MKLEKDRVYILSGASAPYPWCGAVRYLGDQDGQPILEIGSRPRHPDVEGIQGVFDLELVELEAV